MKPIALLALLVMSACAPTGKLVRMQAQVEIDRPIEDVFAFASEPLNDTAWRAETEGFTSSGPAGPGVLYDEVINVGIQNGFEMHTRVTGYESPRLIRAESRDGRVFFAQRDFYALGPERTRVVYTVAADDHLIRSITILPLDAGFAGQFYQIVIRSYLDRLKTIMESGADRRLAVSARQAP